MSTGAGGELPAVVVARARSAQDADRAAAPLPVFGGAVPGTVFSAGIFLTWTFPAGRFRAFIRLVPGLREAGFFFRDSAVVAAVFVVVAADVLAGDFLAAVFFAAGFFAVFPAAVFFGAAFFAAVFFAAVFVAAAFFVGFFVVAFSAPDSFQAAFLAMVLSAAAFGASASSDSGRPGSAIALESGSVLVTGRCLARAGAVTRPAARPAV
ncbi:MAG: hypothetical protein H0W24_06555, partial [Lysobacter sp.]|nr:hypothetical protein [Lysobacter sp.]